MNIDTGEILALENVKKLPKTLQKKFIEIPLDQEKEVFAMNRHDRRKWAKLQRSNHE